MNEEETTTRTKGSLHTQRKFKAESLTKSINKRWECPTSLGELPKTPKSMVIQLVHLQPPIFSTWQQRFLFVSFFFFFWLIISFPFLSPNVINTSHENHSLPNPPLTFPNSIFIFYFFRSYFSHVYVLKPRWKGETRRLDEGNNLQSSQTMALTSAKGQLCWITILQFTVKQVDRS